MSNSQIDQVHSTIKSKTNIIGSTTKNCQYLSLNSREDDENDDLDLQEIIDKARHLITKNRIKFSAFAHMLNIKQNKIYSLFETTKSFKELNELGQVYFRIINDWTKNIEDTSSCEMTIKTESQFEDSSQKSPDQAETRRQDESMISEATKDVDPRLSETELSLNLDVVLVANRLKDILDKNQITYKTFARNILGTKEDILSQLLEKTDQNPQGLNEIDKKLFLIISNWMSKLDTIMRPSDSDEDTSMSHAESSSKEPSVKISRRLVNTLVGRKSKQDQNTNDLS